MKRLGTRVNLIPVIAKADTLTQNDLAKFKQRVSTNITIAYDAPSGYDPTFTCARAPIYELEPFAVGILLITLHSSFAGQQPFTGSYHLRYKCSTHAAYPVGFRYIGCTDSVTYVIVYSAVAMPQNPGRWHLPACVIPHFN